MTHWLTDAVELFWVWFALALVFILAVSLRPARWWRYRQIRKEREMRGVNPLDRLALDAIARWEKR